MHRIHDLFEFRISDKFKAGPWLHIPIVCEIKEHIPAGTVSRANRLGCTMLARMMTSFPLNRSGLASNWQMLTCKGWTKGTGVASPKTTPQTAAMKTLSQTFIEPHLITAAVKSDRGCSYHEDLGWVTPNKCSRTSSVRRRVALRNGLVISQLDLAQRQHGPRSARLVTTSTAS